MQTPEKLSVVVPAYNEAATIGGTLLSLYGQAQVSGVESNFVVVDNGSADATRGVIAAFQRDHEGFPLKVVEEFSKKGTGAACATGFRWAFERGADIVARTDADSCPRYDWERTIHHHMSTKPHLQMIGGRIVGLRDAHYKPLDDYLLLKLMLPAGRLALSIKERNLMGLKYPFGANMAVRKGAYMAAGGFLRISIAEADEDKLLAKEIAKIYGSRAVALRRDMVVASSMRRIRALGGYDKVFLYYFYGEDRVRRAELNGGEPDVR